MVSFVSIVMSVLPRKVCCSTNIRKFVSRAQEALDQINNKHYADAFALRGKTVEKIGMNFMIDEDKTIVLDWWKFGE